MAASGASENAEALARIRARLFPADPQGRAREGSGIEVRIGTKVGYRIWLLGYDGMLHSTNGTLWEPGIPLVAECRTGSVVSWGAIRFLHPKEVASPVDLCTCGIYSTTDLDTLERYHMQYVATVGRVVLGYPAKYKSVIVGTVQQWGHIIEYERGFKSQLAYPQMFVVFEDSQKSDPSLLQYGVPILKTEYRPKVETGYEMLDSRQVTAAIKHAYAVTPTRVDKEKERERRREMAMRYAMYAISFAALGSSLFALFALIWMLFQRMGQG